MVVVDQNVDNLDLIKTIFEYYSAQVIAVASTSEAWEIIRQWKPNILVSEISISEHDGYWLIDKLRNLKSPIKRIPAIAVTGLMFDEVGRHILESGFSEYLVKPFDPDELIMVVLRLILKTKFDFCLRRYQRKN